ncbi:MAG: replicative DNA helicase [Syntrophales bacterium]|jgi:replicative DNA helicase|nr:replicative DNA helicase [Syntrophales bacterium]
MKNNLDPSLCRVLPHDYDAERAVIGGLMLDNQAAGDVLSVLDSDGQDFYHTAHRSIFRAILDLIDKNTVADLITVCDELRSRGTLDKVGGPVYVSEVQDGAISAANIRHYCKIVKSKAIERHIISEAGKLIEAAYSPTIDTNEALNQAQKVILSLSLAREGNKTMHVSRDLARDTFAMIEKRHTQGGALVGLPTGLRDLDDRTLGLQNADLVIIAGRPGMGKSTLAGNIAMHSALSGVSVLLFSLEMPAESLMTRILAGMSRIDSRQLRRGFVCNDQWSRLADAASRIGAAPLFIDDKVDVTPAEIRAKARRLKAEHGLGLLIIDYIQLMRVSGRHDTREQAVAEISRTLKAIARELEIPVIGLSQLNRQVDSRTNKRPMLSDLRESGAIEQDADVIAFIYRDEVYNKSESNLERGIAEIEIAKHRNGPTGTIKLRFDAKTQTFADLQG